MRLLWFNLATDIDDSILGFATRWVEAMAKRVEFIHVITMRAGRYELPENVWVYSVGKEKGYSEPKRAVEFYRHLFRILREDRIDACFSHMIPIFTVLAAPVLKAWRVSIVTWFLHPSLTWRLKLAHHLSDKMVTGFETSYPYKKDKLIVIGHAIDTDLFAPDGTSPEDPPMILCVGRLSPVKDHPTLLRASAILRRKLHKPFRVVILGGPLSESDRAYVRQLENMVEEVGLKDFVEFVPPMPQQELPQWYRRCTVHVNLTPTGSGDKVALEAMACGRPCLVANEGFRETVGRYADQLLFKYASAEELAKRLEKILTMPFVKRGAMGLYLREQVIKMHSLQRLIDKLLNLMDDIRNKRVK